MNGPCCSWWPTCAGVRPGRRPGHGYDRAVDEEAFDYTWYWFERMRAFFRKTADEGRAMVFTAEQ
jgi:Domain of unknown function (DUF1877)